ncbi:MAG: hypothetical protein GF317_19780 [Candidatus Lokiarchaeota archaeon]|nr:hypothetical protein [Candidatus Lokiarchaeota archaeon]MBD3201735.1 hypothetical protein [Candidatus Lokiarchaeota archaeon]
MNSWLNQKHYYVSDLPFLIGLFFLIIIPSKLLDLLSTYIALQVVYEVFLAILKIRFIIAVINTLPLLFFSIGFLLYYISLTEKYGFLDDKNNRDKIQRIIVLMIIVAQLIAILFAIHHSSIITITSFLVFPSLLMITWIFVFSHKNRKYPKIDSLLVSIGFSLYLLTALFRSIAHFIIEPIFYISFSEIFESITIFIIFMGLIRKSN